MNKNSIFFIGCLACLALTFCNKTSSSIVSKRPVWLIGHHCNANYVRDTGVLHSQEDRDVYKALASGCNGVEVDLSYRESDNEIVLYHTGEILKNAETLTQFLALPEMNDSRLTMIVFDIKDSEYIKQVVETTHTFYDNTALNQRLYFVYSVNELSKLKVDNDLYFRFREIAPLLWKNEALEIDYEDDADAVQEMFNDIKFTRGIFGNGIFSGQAHGDIEQSCKKAISIKYNNTSNPYRFKAVESWTVNSLETENLIIYKNVGLLERIEWGCDIVLVDGFKSLDKETYNTFYTNDLFKQNTSVRLANISDYPF